MKKMELNIIKKFRLYLIQQLNLLANEKSEQNDVCFVGKNSMLN